MLELTEKRLMSVIWILENKNKSWSVYEMRKGTAKMLGADDMVYKKGTRVPIVNLSLTYRPVLDFVKELEKSRFILKDERTSEYSVARVPDLVKLVSLARPVTSLIDKAIGYKSPLDFEGTMRLVQASGLEYSFTMFAGSELYRSYVMTDQVHAYIREGDEKKWEEYLLPKKCLRAEKAHANIFLLPTKNEVLIRQARKLKGFSIAPTPILLSDLWSFGGLGEEQARFLMDAWLENRM